ncbi:CYTH and CHAD domain-containing protein [Pseudonocardia thermophila]|uniref:CYTH and CHAD domain-containing protein n=1 Tax=Pseudonocardia thermophila TaxID=1848 RepID=UPI00248EA47D|nr:CYTH and CHAD domain-containing protein [Pseudonocardia thermophila]
MTTQRDVERTYRGAGAAAPDWAAADLRAVVDPHDESLHAVYFDTAERDLLRYGITLRHERGAGRAAWALKIPDGPDARHRVEVPGDRDAVWLEWPPPELTALVRAAVRGRPVDVAATVHTRRRRTVLCDATGRELAEVADDLVEAAPARIGDDAAPERRRWREIDVELDPAVPPATLDVLERAFLDAGLRRGSPSKLPPALGAPQPQPDREPATAGEVLVAEIYRRTRELVLLDPLVRLERPDSVHRMRVCCRRIRSVLRVFGRVLDRERTRGLDADLQWLGEVLGVARDLEVLHARIAAAEPELTAVLDAHFAPRRTAAAEEVLAALDGARYVELLAALDDLAANPPFTKRAWRPAEEVLRKELERAARRIAATLHGARTTAEATDRDLALHHARKAAKRLRYAAEAAAPVAGRRADRFARAAHALQDLLGERQDAVTARPILREIAASVSGSDGFRLGVLHEREGDVLRRTEAELAAVGGALHRALR